MTDEQGPPSEVEGEQPEALAVGAAPAPSPWPVLGAWLLVGLATVFVTGMFVVAVALATNTPLDPDSVTALLVSPRVLLVSAAIPPCLLVAGAIGATWLEGARWRERWRLGRAVPAAHVAALVGLLAAGHAAESVVMLLGWEPKGALELLRQAILGMSFGQLAAAVVVIGLMAGVAEEIFMRGYVQTRLVEAWGRWPAILVASLLFGILHLDWMHSPLAFLMGIFLGWVVERTGSLRPAIFAHVLNNVSSVILTRIVPPDIGPALHAALLLVALAALAASVAWLRRLTR